MEVYPPFVVSLPHVSRFFPAPHRVPRTPNWTVVGANPGLGDDISYAGTTDVRHIGGSRISYDVQVEGELFPWPIAFKVIEKLPNFARIPGLLVNSDGLPAGYGCVNGHLDMISTPTEAISLEQL